MTGSSPFSSLKGFNCTNLVFMSPFESLILYPLAWFTSENEYCNNEPL